MVIRWEGNSEGACFWTTL